VIKNLKFNLTLSLFDKPGRLIQALNPIAKNGGNIITILHERDRSIEGFVPVRLVVDFNSYKNLENAIKDLNKLDIKIVKSEEIIDKINFTIILIGYINFEKLIKIKSFNVKSSGFEVVAPFSKKPCVKVDFQIPMDQMNNFFKKIKKIARDEKSILIPSIEEVIS
jgi:ACT domain-containing protein